MCASAPGGYGAQGGAAGVPRVDEAGGAGPGPAAGGYGGAAGAGGMLPPSNLISSLIGHHF
jgi:hypothetical protein